MGDTWLPTKLSVELPGVAASEGIVVFDSRERHLRKPEEMGDPQGVALHHNESAPQEVHIGANEDAQTKKRRVWGKRERCCDSASDQKNEKVVNFLVSESSLAQCVPSITPAYWCILHVRYGILLADHCLINFSGAGSVIRYDSNGRVRGMATPSLPSSFEAEQRLIGESFAALALQRKKENPSDDGGEGGAISASQPASTAAGQGAVGSPPILDSAAEEPPHADNSYSVDREPISYEPHPLGGSSSGGAAAGNNSYSVDREPILYELPPLSSRGGGGSGGARPHPILQHLHVPSASSSPNYSSAETGLSASRAALLSRVSKASPSAAAGLALFASHPGAFDGTDSPSALLTLTSHSELDFFPGGRLQFAEAVAALLQPKIHVSIGGEEFCMPEQFGIVEHGLYRCAFPTPEMYSFLRRLRVRTVINLLDKFPTEYEAFVLGEGIQYLHAAVKGNKAHPEEMDRGKVRRALSVIMDARSHPVLVHCR